jgi:fused signal recognition particle receptor
MFDGLRESLNRFSSDVDEAAEVEEVEDEEALEADDAGDAPVDDGADDAEPGGAVEDETEPEEAVDELDDDEPETPGFAGRVGSLARGRVVIDEDDIEGPLRELELALLSNDVEMGVAETVIERVREELVGETRKLTHGTGSVAEDALAEALLSVVSVGGFDFDGRIAEAEKPVVIVFTGVNGVGKTTSIAKVSRHLAERGYDTVWANGDTYRAGGNGQLLERAEELDRKCIAHEQGGDPAAVI